MSAQRFEDTIRRLFPRARLEAIPDAGHWLHAARYNMDMVVMLFDNAIYGLTKKQSSPTTPIGSRLSHTSMSGLSIGSTAPGCTRRPGRPARP